MIPKDTILSKIKTYLMLLNAGQNSHSNRVSEDFYCGLLNIILDTNLKNLNIQEANTPAIDLGDEAKRICVRISAAPTYASIDHILKTFLSNGLQQQYSWLIILDLDGTGKSYQSKVITDGFSFLPERDIWNIEFLLRKIETMDVERMEQLAEYLAEQSVLPEAETPPLNLPLPAILSHNDFIGRVNELAQLEAAIAEGRKPVLLSGLGGMGKTQLACQFGKNYAAQGNSQVYFATFLNSFSRTVVDCIANGLPTPPDPSFSDEQIVEFTLTQLSQYSKNDLLIIDGVENPDQSFSELTLDPVYAKLCALPLRLLFTTRYCEPEAINITALPPSDLYFLFRDQKLTLSEEDMDELIRASQSHTLTIALISRALADPYLQATPQQIVQALKECNLAQTEFSAVPCNGRNDADLSLPLCALFELIQFSEREATILRYATLFPQGGISETLFLACLFDNGKRDIINIVNRGWLNLENGLLTVHPAIKTVLRKKLKPSDRNCSAFLFELNKQSQRTNYDQKILRQMAEVFFIAAESLEDQNAAWILNASRLWITLGEGSQVLEDLLRHLDQWEKNPSNNQDRLFFAYSQAGITYMLQGNYTDAEAYLKRALELSIPKSTRRSICLSNLASINNSLGNYEQSLKYLMEALEIQEQSATVDPLALASIYSNIALTYSELGNHTDALKNQENALRLRKNALPVDHPDIATTLNNLGMIYANLGDKATALKNLKRALEIREKLLPGNYPSIALSYHNIGGLYGEQGNHREALIYKRKAVSILEKELPQGHPDLAAAYSSLGSTYEIMDMNRDALEFYKKAVVTMQANPSASRTQLANYLALAAFTNAKLSDFTEAIQFMRQAISYASVYLPEDHSVLLNYQKYLDAFERMQQSSEEPVTIY